MQCLIFLWDGKYPLKILKKTPIYSKIFSPKLFWLILILSTHTHPWNIMLHSLPFLAKSSVPFNSFLGRCMILVLKSKMSSFYSLLAGSGDSWSNPALCLQKDLIGVKESVHKNVPFSIIGLDLICQCRIKWHLSSFKKPKSWWRARKENFI